MNNVLWPDQIHWENIAIKRTVPASIGIQFPKKGFQVTTPGIF